VGPFARALDIGCSIGVLAEMLAPRCDELVAVDISAIAIERARTRLASYPNVRCERRTLPEEMPDGPFDLVVCSDILYYWPTETLLRAIETLQATLAPQGRLVCLHWRAKPDAVHSGDEVHDLLVERLRELTRVESRVVLDSRLDVFARPETAAEPVPPGRAECDAAVNVA
jgi:SAM-dependent methyltransferase